MKLHKLFLVFLVLVVVTGCSTGKKTPNSKPEEIEDMPSYDKGGFVGNDSVGAPNAVAPDKQKIIMSISLRLETKDYKTTIQKIEELTSSVGGYVQFSDIPKNPNGEKFSGLVANFTLMIPTKNIDQFVTSTGEISNIVQESRNSEDITDVYLDTSLRIRTLKTKEERLIELLKKSGTLADLLMIESELSNTRFEIERLEGQLKNFDTRIQYTQFQVNVSEVYTYTPAKESMSIWERIADEFHNNWINMMDYAATVAVFVVSGLPFVLFQLAIFFLPLFFLGKLLWKKYRLQTKATKDE